jgi:hypothetical protein
MSKHQDARHQRTLRALKADPDVSRLDPQLRQHLEKCNDCQETLDASVALRARLRQHLSVEAPSGLVRTLRARVEALEAQAQQFALQTQAGQGERPTEARPARSEAISRRAWLWGAVPAALAAGIVLGILLSRPEPTVRDGEVIKTIAEYLEDVTHDRHLLERTGRPYEIAATDPAEASEWLSRGLGFDVELPASLPDWELAGIRVWHTVSRLSALAGYEDPAGTEIMVFAVPASELLPRGLEPVTTSAGPAWIDEGWSQTGVAWLENGLAWSAVAPLPRSELLEWTTTYRQAQRR